MAALKGSRNLTIVAMLVVVGLAVAFWMLLLGPKREEASRLGRQIGRVEASLAAHREEAANAEQARRRFPVDYRRLVVLGAAAPEGDETASLLVQLNGIARRAHVRFVDLTQSGEGGGGGGEEASAPPPPSSPTGEPVPATEVEASLLPLGASIGPAGLAVMPYSLTFTGNFFQIADFVHGLDALVKSENENVAVKGRLLTVDDFSLAPEGEAEGAGGKRGSGGSPVLTATFSVTTYVTPPRQSLGAGASPAGPGAPWGPRRRRRPPPEAHREAAADSPGEGARDPAPGLPRRPLLRPARQAAAAAGRPRGRGDRRDADPAGPEVGAEASAGRGGRHRCAQAGERPEGLLADRGRGEPGLRDYRKRLRGKPTDPFRKGPRPSLKGARLGGGGGGGGSSQTTSTSTSTSTSTTVKKTGSGKTTKTTTETTKKTNGSPAAFGAAGAGGESGGGAQGTLYTWAADLTIVHSTGSEAGGDKQSDPPLKFTGVLGPTTLPSEKTQVVTYIGRSPKTHRATFLVSSEVTGVFGEGKCAAGNGTCQLIELETGMPEVFELGEDADRYVVKVTKLESVPDGHP